MEHGVPGETKTPRRHTGNTITALIVPQVPFSVEQTKLPAVKQGHQLLMIITKRILESL